MVVVGDKKKKVYDMSYLFSRHAQVCMWVVCEEEKKKKGDSRLVCGGEVAADLCYRRKTTRDTLSLYRT